MTDIQKCLMQLIKEIDECCREQKLKYALYGRTAGRAKKNHEFASSCYEFHIMMFARDVLKLKEALSKNKNPKRGFEDLSVNPNLPYNIIRYVDLSTTLLDRQDPFFYSMPGIAVTIHPLFSHYFTKTERAFELSQMLKNACVVDEKYQADKIKLAVKVASKVGNKTAAKVLNHALEKEADAKYGKKVFLHLPNGRAATIDSNAVKATKPIDFEGMKLPVSANAEAYFEQHYGADWAKKSIVPLRTSNRIVVLYDVNRPFTRYADEFAKAGIDLKAFQKKVLDYYNWMNGDYQTHEDKVDYDFSIARRSVMRIDLYCKYKGKLAAMKKNADAKKYDKLAKQLKGYLKHTDKFYEQGIGFYINDEIFSYAKLVWKHEGRGDFADKVYALVPDLYKTEDIETFIQKHNTNNNS